MNRPTANNINHSERRLVTGFPKAALTDWKLMVSKVMQMTDKLRISISTLYFKFYILAELNTSSTSGHKKRSGVKKSKKLSTRVDLTPMVDLGFLLITFFIFTTTRSQPRAMRLVLPKDLPNPITQKESGALTLIPSGNDRIFYYEGKDPSKLKSASFQSLREIIHNKQNKTNPADFMVILKPTSACNYKNTIASLDEMAINKVAKYALVDISLVESKLVEEMERNYQ